MTMHKLENLRKWNQNRAKINPKSVQNRFQMGPKSVQNQFRDHLRFRGRFWFGSDAILDPTWAYLGGQVGAMLGPCWPSNRFLEVLEGAQKRQGNLILV